MAAFSAQEEQRSILDTRRRLELAAEAVIGFAIAQGRLPCPATSGSAGAESLSTGTMSAGGACTTNFGGFLPARSVGFAPQDNDNFGVDAWGNRLRYAVSSTITGCTGTESAHFTTRASLKANGLGCRPNDLVVCQSSTGTAPGGSPPSCGTANAVTDQGVVAFIVYSTGKNGASAAIYGADETANSDGDALFVSREPGGQNTSTSIYDDQLLWIPVGTLYGKLTTAGVLP
jgi:hypothetical protein